MIRTADGFAAPVTLRGPILRRIGMAITGVAAEGYRAYAVMVPKATQEELERTLVVESDEPNTIYGLEIIECSVLPRSEPFVLLYR